MSNRIKTPLAPKLRFPEFRQADGWTAKRLKDACEVNPANAALPESFVYIDLESVEAGKLTARKTIAKDEAPSRAQRLLHPDDVIFQIVRPYQRNNFHFKTSEGLDYVASTGYAQLRAKDSADFLFQAVHVDGFVDRVIAKCTGSSYPAINSSDLAEVPLAIPKPDEQQKIANCLSSLDDLIAAQARKVDAFKTHKKGLMQQLFPQEGESQPRLRFPEFENAGEWECDSMQDVFVFRQGLQVAVENQFLENEEDRTRFIRIIDITQCNEPPRYITVTKGANIVSSEDLFMIRYGTPGVVAIGYEGVIANNLFQLIFKNSKNHSPFFWHHYLQTKYEEISSMSGSSSMPAISFKTLNHVEVKYPPLPEQQRIADCLTSLDALVTAATQKLETLKTHKKGLMQQLFPIGENK